MSLESFEHIELPAKLLDCFLRSNKRNINQPHHITQYRVSIPRTCTGAGFFQLWAILLDVMWTLISNDLTILKRSLVWPTQSLKLSMVQVYRVTRFPYRLMMVLCADARCLKSASFVIFLLISNLLYSEVFFSFSSHSSVIVSLIVGHPTTVYGNFDVAVCARLSWGLATWREAVDEDCQSAIFEATRPACCIVSHHEPRWDQLHNSKSSHQWQ